MKQNIFLLYLILIFLPCNKVFAQEYPVLKTLPQLKCLHTSNGVDSLLFPGKRERFDSLYMLFDSLCYHKTGTLNILHIGGSHVQAGHFTHRMRTNLSSFGGIKTGSRGLLFPFKAIKTNAPVDYALTCKGEWGGSRCVSRNAELPLGLSGAYALTSDTAAALVLDLSSISDWPIHKIRVLGEGTDSCVRPILFCAGDTIVSQPSDGKPGYSFLLPEQADSCVISFQGLIQDSLHFAVRGIWPESDEPGLTYLSSGVNGASLPSWLRCSLFAEELALAPPHLVIFGIGINDANVLPKDFDKEKFKADYRLLMQRILTVNPLCCFVFITNNDCWFSVRGRRRQYNTNTPKVQQAMHELAQECDGAVFDAFQLMGGMRSSAAWVRAGLQRADHIHFTREGYELWGDLLYNALMMDYNRTKVDAPSLIDESMGQNNEMVKEDFVSSGDVSLVP